MTSYADCRLYRPRMHLVCTSYSRSYAMPSRHLQTDSPRHLPLPSRRTWRMSQARGCHKYTERQTSRIKYYWVLIDDVENARFEVPWKTRSLHNLHVLKPLASRSKKAHSLPRRGRKSQARPPSDRPAGNREEQPTSRTVQQSCQNLLEIEGGKS